MTGLLKEMLVFERCRKRKFIGGLVETRTSPLVLVLVLNLRLRPHSRFSHKDEERLLFGWINKQK